MQTDLLPKLVSDCEVEPLHVSTGIGVRPQEQLVFIFCCFYYQVQVATLETTLKGQTAVDLRVHAFKGSPRFFLGC